MNKQKGFTIIELIVVIAIIAVLASIVLVNVTTYISKAKDAKIKSDLASIALVMGSCYGLNNPTSYTNCFVTVAGTDYVPAALEKDINDAGGELVVKVTDTTGAAYCASSKLASDATKFICTDSTGVTKDNLSAGCGTATFCPVS